MINILTRTHRTELFKNCVESIKAQTYKNIRLIVCVDRDELFDPTLEVLSASKLNFEIIRVQNTGVPYHWNFYCNNLKSRVKEGWFFYLDDDDELVNSRCLETLRKHLSPDYGTMCQFLRGGKPKPKYNQPFRMKSEDIIRGKIGGSAIVLHHSHKDLAHWDGERAADYRFMRDVCGKLRLEFVPVIVVRALNSGRHGK